MILPTSGNSVMLTTAADAVGDVFYDGFRVENAASPRVRASTSGAVSITDGYSFTNTGRLVYADATAGLPAGTVWCNGVPFNNGALCVSTNAAAVWENGLPFDSNGAVAAGITP